MSPWLRSSILRIYSVFGEKRLSGLVSNIRILDKDEFLDKVKRFQELKAEFIQHWKANGFDAIVCPVFSLPALDIGTSQDLIGFNQISFLFNFLDMPAGTIPITLSDDNTYKDKYNDSYTKMITNMMKTSKGLPISIQVGALPYQDELVLRLMKEVDSYYRYDLNHAHKVLKVLESSK